MFPLRHAAARLLTSRSIAISTRSRTITSFTSVSQRQSRIAAPLQFQRRWASSEAAEKEQAPISQLQPTPEEEVENVIQTEGLDNPAGTAAPSEADSSKAPQIAETANATEATEDITNTAAEPEDVQETIDAIPSRRDMPNPAAGLTEGLEDTRQDTRPRRAAPGEPATPKSTIYVGNLFFDVTEVMLQKEFSKFGSIDNVRLIRDARGLSKGFGYISFKDVETATSAIDEMNQQLFEGRRLMVSFAHTDSPPRSQTRDHRPINPPSKTLFIGNMSFEMTDRDLNNLFRGIRNVIDVRVAIDRRTGQPRGFAHADFVDTKSAMEAMKILQGKETYGRALRVDYSFGPSTAPRNTPR